MNADKGFGSIAPELDLRFDEDLIIHCKTDAGEEIENKNKPGN